ncbi:MAG TPA: hypothetical protein VM223_01830 [Planctomycetota bacterium]|nr:hypothetical protein [Planctomycetota bacterium]
MVGTVNKSMAAVWAMWFLMKLRQVWDGGFGCRAMYLATVHLGHAAKQLRKEIDDPNIA